MTKQILIVDNNKSVAFFLGENLADSGPNYQLQIAHSGSEALAKVTATLFDLVITDLRLPDISGLDLICELQKFYPSIQTILITANGSDRVEVEAYRLGTFRYLAKPFSIELLIQVVREVLDPFSVAPKVQVSPLILILEDDFYLLNLYCKALRQKGYKVRAAVSLPDVMEFLALCDVDVFICDIHGSNEHRPELLSEHLPEFRAQCTDVVIVSENALYKPLYVGMGVSLYLERPVFVSHLVAQVSQLIDKGTVKCTRYDC